MIDFSALPVSGRCKYPLGQSAPFMFCGDKTKPGSPYCCEHHELCYYPSERPWQSLASMVDAVEQTVLPCRGGPPEVEPELDGRGEPGLRRTRYEPIARPVSEYEAALAELCG